MKLQLFIVSLGIFGLSVGDEVQPDNINQENLEIHEHDSLVEADKIINQRLGLTLNTNKAKNVVLIAGGNIDLPLDRTFRKQLAELAADDPYLIDNLNTFYDSFVDTGIARTYCADSFDPDVACASTALFTGVANNLGTIAVSKDIPYGAQTPQKCVDNALESIMKHAQEANKLTGFITTGMVTGPEVSPLYGHTSNYHWQSDADMLKDNFVSPGCDLATQMVQNMTGYKASVIMGGGSVKFLPRGNCGNGNAMGERVDGVNLIDRWLALHQSCGRAAYVQTKAELDSIDPATSYLLGLFNSGDLVSISDRPSLAHMAIAAINILSKGPQGYFLVIRGSQLNADNEEDIASSRLRQIHELINCLAAVKKHAKGQDTLIVYTSDLAQGNTVSQEALSQSDADAPQDQDETVTTYEQDSQGNVILHTHKKHLHERKSSEKCHPVDPTEDVVLYATGAYSHLLRGMYDQSTVPYVINYAACYKNDNRITVCNRGC